LLAVCFLPAPIGVAAAPPAPVIADAPADDTLAKCSGTVQRYLMNEFGDVDGILADNDDAIRFPPHMSQDLVAALKPGDRFVAQGRRLPGGGFQAYSLGKEGSKPLVESRPTATDTARPRPDVRVGALVAMTVDGAIVAILRGPDGDADGIVLEDGTIVKLPPHSRFVAPDGLRLGATVHAAGYGTRNRYGQSLRAEQFAFDGQPLTSLQPPGPTAPPKAPPAIPGRPPA